MNRFWRCRRRLAILLGMSDVTRILSQIEEGDPQAAEKLLPLVYEELRKLAAVKLAQEKPGQTLVATALVHEAYLRLVDGETRRSYRDHKHFFASAATAMRRILVDSARAKRTEKRGGGRERKPLEEVSAPLPDDELLALHEALEQLAVEEPLKAQLVELRYFAGLTGEQAAEILGISASAADRHWAFARAWLQTKVRGQAAG
jgi:RNA polymerase sigma factor (TIGR02999 family)